MASGNPNTGLPQAPGLQEALPGFSSPLNWSRSPLPYGVALKVNPNLANIFGGVHLGLPLNLPTFNGPSVQIPDRVIGHANFSPGGIDPALVDAVRNALMAPPTGGAGAPPPPTRRPNPNIPGSVSGSFSLVPPKAAPKAAPKATSRTAPPVVIQSAPQATGSTAPPTIGTDVPSGVDTTGTDANTKDMNDFVARLLGGLFPKTDPYAGLGAQAQHQAEAIVNQQVKALTDQQTLLQQQAQTRANQIALASQASANLLNPIADQTLNAYRNAAQDQVAFAGGYQGELGGIAQGEAQKVAQDLRAAGAPANTSTISGVNTATQPQGLGNILYSLGGALPASTLEQSGLASSTYQRQLPAAALGAGNAAGLAALGAGTQAANALIPDITAAENKLPTLETSILAGLTSTASAREKNRLATLLDASTIVSKADASKLGWAKLTSSTRTALIKAGITKDYYNGILAAKTASNDIAQQNANTHAVSVNNAGRVAQENADTNATRVNNNTVNQTNQTTLARGRLLVAEKNAATSWYRATHPSAGRLSKKDLSKSINEIYTNVNRAHDGFDSAARTPLNIQGQPRVFTSDPGDGKPWSSVNPDNVTYTNHFPPLTQDAALIEMKKAGLLDDPSKKALAMRAWAYTYKNSFGPPAPLP